MNIQAFTIAVALLAIIFGGWLYLFRDETLLGSLCSFCGIAALAGMSVIWFVDKLIAVL
jgi:hypothetical protein